MKSLVSRVGRTNSREDLREEQEGWSRREEQEDPHQSSPHKAPEPRRRLEMRQYLEPAVVKENLQSHDRTLINTVRHTTVFNL